MRDLSQLCRAEWMIFPKKTIVIFEYKEHAQRFHAVLTRAVRVSRDWPVASIFTHEMYFYVHCKEFASRGYQANPRLRDWFRSASNRPRRRYVVFVARLYSNVVPVGLSRCKTRNTTRQIMPPRRPLASADHRRLACTELRGATTKWIETYR